MNINYILKFVILFSITVIVACGKKEHASPSASSTKPQAGATPAASTPNGPILLSRDPEFWKYFNKDLPIFYGDDYLNNYSPAWKIEIEKINNSVLSINDLTLREIERKSLLSKIDRNKFKLEADGHYKEINKKYIESRTKYFQQHSSDWLEIGSFLSFDDYHNWLLFEQSKANIFNIKDHLISIPISIRDVDFIFSKLREIEQNTIAQAVQPKWAWTQERIRREFAVELASGDQEKIKYINTMIDSDMKKDRENVEVEVRKNALVLAGQGNIMTGNIEALVIMDRNNNNIIFKVPMNEFIKQQNNVN